MTPKKVLDHVKASLKGGAELRIKIVQENGPAVIEAAGLMAACFRLGGKALLFGNGCSVADARHLAAEFPGWFVRERWDYRRWL